MPGGDAVMSRQLPVPLRNEPNGRALAVPSQRSTASSQLVKLVVALTPDIVRAAERAVLRRAERHPAIHSEQRAPSRSIHLSEVEIDLDMPFVRRVVVRNATAWSTFPAEPEPAGRSGVRRVGRFIGMSGALALVAGLMARRVMPGGWGRVIDVEGRAKD